MEENSKLLVKLDEREIAIDVFDIIDNEETGKQYIIYTIDGDSNEDVYMSILEETEDSFTLKEIKDDKEAKMVEGYLEEMLEGEVGNNG